MSVQNPDFDIRFIRRVFKKKRNRNPFVLREDFCGSAYLACRWILFHSANRSVGIDIDRRVLEWGYIHHVALLPERLRSRISLLHQDVRVSMPPEFDVICALNYSYFVFRKRSELLEYFSSVHASLNPSGIFVLDIFGGYDTRKPMEEKKTIGGKKQGFTYVWEQELFDPITHRFVAHIHFFFPDGTAIKKAFSYDWRLWSIPEVNEVLKEAGFESIEIYWEGVGKNGKGNGRFRRTESAHDDPCWNAYIVAEKSSSNRS
ncbi:MAG: class I SAM-dependent methyltransferase [Deltaproteobacteria bacterium]|nr:class I SAM-dependent methyltransferase [Deltaproteobacteria bacterium]